MTAEVVFGRIGEQDVGVDHAADTEEDQQRLATDPVADEAADGLQQHQEDQRQAG